MAVTPWWFCPSCGFENKPHANRRAAANEKCEQCGSPQSDAAAVDYVPGGGR